MEARAERRCARCKKLSRAMLKNREGHHSDDAVKKGYELRCEKIALCITAFRVAALWCTKLACIVWNLMMIIRFHQLLKSTPLNRKEILLLPGEEVLSSRRKTTWFSDHHVLPCAPLDDKDLLAFCVEMPWDIFTGLTRSEALRCADML